MRDMLEGIRTGKSDLTVNDLYARWVGLKKGLKDNTLASYKYTYDHLVAAEFGKRKIADLKRTDVRAFYNSLADRRGLKPNTVDSVHTVLRQVLELGVEDEYLRYNPADHALTELRKAHSRDEKMRRTLTLQEQSLFEAYLAKPGRHHRWYPIFTVMLWTGMRVGEITGLRWCDIDLDGQTVSVNHTLVYYKRENGRCEYGINPPKSRAGVRIIPMLPKVKAAFLEERQYQEETGLRCTMNVEGYTDFIFLNRLGGVQQQGSLNGALERIVRDCNAQVWAKRQENQEVTLLPKISNHSLRHTFATRMCEAGVNIKAMQQILGHADCETTMDIYVEATQDLQRSEMTNLAKYFGSLQ